MLVCITQTSTTSLPSSDVSQQQLDAIVVGIRESQIHLFAQPINQIFVPPQHISLHQGLDINTPATRTRIPSKWVQSPFLIKFESTDKGKTNVIFENRPTHPFEVFGICYQCPKEIIDAYTKWIAKELLVTHE